jgi:hypothetical protein
MEELLYIEKELGIIFDRLVDRSDEPIDVIYEFDILQGPYILIALPQPFDLFPRFCKLPFDVTVLTFGYSHLLQLGIQAYRLGREVGCKKTACCNHHVQSQMDIEGDHRKRTSYNCNRYGNQ